MFEVTVHPHQGGHFLWNQYQRGIDRIAVTFDDPNLVANAGLLLVVTLVRRLDLEPLCNANMRLTGRSGGSSRPARP